VSAALRNRSASKARFVLPDVSGIEFNTTLMMLVGSDWGKPRARAQIIEISPFPPVKREKRQISVIGGLSFRAGSHTTEPSVLC
jgi:hypothetical protein